MVVQAPGSREGTPTWNEGSAQGHGNNSVSWIPKIGDLKAHTHKALTMSSLFCCNENVKWRYRRCDKQNIHGLFWKNPCMWLSQPPRRAAPIPSLFQKMLLQPEAGHLPKATATTGADLSPFPDSRIGVLNPQTLPIGAVIMSHIIRRAGTAQLLYVQQSQSHFWLNRASSLHELENCWRGLSTGLSGSNFHAQSLDSTVGGPEGTWVSIESQDVHSGRRQHKKLSQGRHTVNRNES